MCPSAPAPLRLTSTKRSTYKTASVCAWYTTRTTVRHPRALVAVHSLAPRRVRQVESLKPASNRTWARRGRVGSREALRAGDIHVSGFWRSGPVAADGDGQCRTIGREMAVLARVPRAELLSHGPGASHPVSALLLSRSRAPGFARRRLSRPQVARGVPRFTL